MASRFGPCWSDLDGLITTYRASIVAIGASEKISAR
jgi:hypothetical protein